MTSVFSPESSSRAGLRVLRNAVGGLALSAALVAAPAPLFAATKVSHNSQAPVDFSADHMEVQDKQNRVVLTGSVDVKQADLRLVADRTLMTYTNADKLTLHRVDATGHVVVTRPDERASGDVAVYDLDRKLITMVGNVSLKRANGDVLNGGRLVTDLNTGVSSVDGHSATAAGAGSPGGLTGGGSGRVSGTFNVPKKDDAKPPAH